MPLLSRSFSHSPAPAAERWLCRPWSSAWVYFHLPPSCLSPFPQRLLEAALTCSALLLCRLMRAECWQQMHTDCKRCTAAPCCSSPALLAPCVLLTPLLLSIPQWLKDPGPRNEKRTLFCDMVCFLFITPLAAISGWLCLRGAQDHLQFNSRLEAIGLIALTIALFTIYVLWTLVSAQEGSARRSWARWCSEGMLRCAPREETS